MRTHRPAQLDAQPFQQLPVALSDRTLGQVEEDCAFATPSAQDTDFAQKLSFAMSDSFADEAARMTKFWDMASREFGMHFIRIRYDTSETDGSATISAGQVLALGANLEVKLDMGTGGGDPRLQNCCYATLYSCDDRQKLLRALCRCPTLLIELAGPNLSLSGFAFGQHLAAISFLRQSPFSGSPRASSWSAPHVLCMPCDALGQRCRCDTRTLQLYCINLCKQGHSWSQQHFSSLLHRHVLTFCVLYCAGILPRAGQQASACGAQSTARLPISMHLHQSGWAPMSWLQLCPAANRLHLPCCGGWPCSRQRRPLQHRRAKLPRPWATLVREILGRGKCPMCSESDGWSSASSCAFLIFT